MITSPFCAKKRLDTYLESIDQFEQIHGVIEAQELLEGAFELNGQALQRFIAAGAP